MATLQSIRSKGPLLLIVIGLALLAFILGDAWKIIRPNQNVQNVGSVDGKNITALEFQDELEKYTSVVKFSMGINDLNEDQNNQIKDEVWSTMVRRKILDKEVASLGLQVTDAEIRDVIVRGVDPILSNTPFNDAEGRFDYDYLKSFLAGYFDLDRSMISPEEMAYYDNIYNYWLFVEDNIKSTLLYQKYVSLITACLISNPAAAQNSYDNRTKRADILMFSLPYSSVSDDEVKVTESDMKKAYNNIKELLYNYAESRDIVYIDYEIEPSQADIDALRAEMNEIAGQLEEMTSDYSSFVRRSSSLFNYSEVARTENALPLDVVERLDSVKEGGVFGPYFNEQDNTYNVFKLLAKENSYDSIQFRMIQISTGSDADNQKTSDSIYNVIKSGADFEEIATQYAQTGAAQWISSDVYESSAITGDNALYINKLNSMNKGELANLKVTGANLIIKVLDKKVPVKKYNAVVIKREPEFSDETSNAAYNKLSAFVGANPTIDQLRDNAEDSDFRLLYYPNFQSYSNNVAGVSKSHEALRWAFAAKEGEVSRIYEVGSNNDHLLVVAVDKINAKGYASIESAKATIAAEALKDKKFEVLSKKLAAAKTAADAKAIPGIMVDTVEYVNFTTPAYIANLFANEPGLGPCVLSLDREVMSAPVKGMGGVYIAEKISPDSSAGEFDREEEDSRIETLASRQIANSILTELYYQANIVDERYKIF